jgi:NADH-quinone oxidoreductase subunit H
MSQFSLISLLDNIGFAFNMTVAVGNPFRFLYALLLLENGVFGGVFFNPYLGMLSDFLFDLKSSYLLSIVFLVLESLALIVPLLIGIAYTTLLERKLMAGIQRRRGPNVVGIYGLLQPLADGLKLFLKETVVPNNANAMIFIFSPILTFFLSLVTWVVIPFEKSSAIVDLNVGMLYLLAVSSLSVYGVIMAGWSSNSKYAFLGALRSAAQLISYEISISVIVLTVLVCVGSLNLSEIVLAQETVWFVFPLFPSFIMFMISGLAETNRAPFDLPEAEAELVSGYNVEYSSMTFALFFLGEYAHMILMGSMSSILFLGGWLPPISIAPFTWVPGYVWFGLKVTSILFFFVWVRAAFPRYRYDQLMRIGWKVFLPLSLGWFLFVVGIVFCFQLHLAI